MRIGKPPLESFSLRFNFDAIDEVTLKKLSDFVDSLQGVYPITPEFTLPSSLDSYGRYAPFTLHSETMDRRVEIFLDYVLMQTQRYQSWNQEREFVLHVLESLKKHLGVSEISDVIMVYIDVFNLPREEFLLSNWFNLNVNVPGWNLAYDDLHVGVSMKEEGMKTICKLSSSSGANDSTSYQFKLQTLMIAEGISHTRNPAELVDRMHDLIIKRFTETLTSDTKKMIEMEDDPK